MIGIDITPLFKLIPADGKYHYCAYFWSPDRISLQVDGVEVSTTAIEKNALPYFFTELDKDTIIPDDADFVIHQWMPPRSES